MRILPLLVLAACSHANKDATPVGAKVFDWDATKSDRAAIKTAQFTDIKPIDRSETVTACGGDIKIKLKLHMETGTATYDEGGSHMQVPALHALTATVEDGADFTFAPGKCEGPNYELTAPGQAPHYTLLDCHARVNKPNNDCLIYLQLKGDGTLLPPK